MTNKYNNNKFFFNLKGVREYIGWILSKKKEYIGWTQGVGK